MQREILIIDDHDDMATALEEVFVATGHTVKVVETREDALAINNIEGYADTMRQGISRLKAARADVVLMDPQFAPRILARPMHVTVVDSISAVGRDMKVAVFRRFAVMQHWISSGQYKLDDIISSDGLHMNDMSYSCIAHLLAGSVVTAAEAGTEGLRLHQGASR